MRQNVSSQNDPDSCSERHCTASPQFHALQPHESLRSQHMCRDSSQQENASSSQVAFSRPRGKNDKPSRKRS